MRAMQVLQATVERQKAQLAAAEKEVEAAKPAVQALERIANTDGSLCVTDAAKTLQMHRDDLTEWLLENGWCYRREEGGPLVAYQAKLDAGLLEHKSVPVTRKDGGRKTVTQARITPKGPAKLGKEISPPN